MFLIQHDKKSYEPKKELTVPYWAETYMGRIVIVTEHDPDGSTVKAVVIKQKDPKDHYSVGDTMPRLALASVTPVAEGEHLVLSNTWEIANG